MVSRGGQCDGCIVVQIISRGGQCDGWIVVEIVIPVVVPIRTMRIDVKRIFGGGYSLLVIRVSTNGRDGKGVTWLSSRAGEWVP